MSQTTKFRVQVLSPNNIAFRAMEIQADVQRIVQNEGSIILYKDGYTLPESIIGIFPASLTIITKIQEDDKDK